MFKKIKLLVLIIFFFLIKTYSFSENNILFIDIEYIFVNSNAGKKVNNEIELERKKINNELATYQKKIQDEKEKLINQKNILSQEELQKKSIDLKNQIDKYNKMLSDMNNQLNKNRNKAKVQFSKELSTIVQKYASDNSIEMIIKKDNILIGKNNLDATQDILKLFNKNVESIKIK
tara:strand:- start:2352 stop:2879 length:528 start_codon:yes stop_codon:yes gene_type:complete